MISNYSLNIFCNTNKTHEKIPGICGRPCQERCFPNKKARRFHRGKNFLHKSLFETKLKFYSDDSCVTTLKKVLLNKDIDSF